MCPDVFGVAYLVFFCDIEIVDADGPVVASRVARWSLGEHTAFGGLLGGVKDRGYLSCGESKLLAEFYDLWIQNYRLLHGIMAHVYINSLYSFSIVTILTLRLSRNERY